MRIAASGALFFGAAALPAAAAAVRFDGIAPGSGGMSGVSLSPESPKSSAKMSGSAGRRVATGGAGVPPSSILAMYSRAL